jgi:hypothetical protein
LPGDGGGAKAGSGGGVLPGDGGAIGRPANVVTGAVGATLPMGLTAVVPTAALAVLGAPTPPAVVVPMPTLGALAPGPIPPEKPAPAPKPIDWASSIPVGSARAGLVSQALRAWACATPSPAAQGTTNSSAPVSQRRR